MTETPENRLRRLRMRSWRRGMREMDLLLGPFADAALADLPPPVLDRYEALLGENDQELYLWVSRARPHPPEHGEILAAIAAFHGLVTDGAKLCGLNVFYINSLEAPPVTRKRRNRNESRLGCESHGPGRGKTIFSGRIWKTLALVERLHRLLLDVVKDEFERLGIIDINSVQALLLFTSATTK